MKQSLSPRDLARAVGVSESSLKRWADRGRIQVARTVGGHRRIPLREAVRFVRAEGLPIVRPDLLGMPELSRAQAYHGAELDEVLFQKLKAGEAEDVRAILVDVYLSGTALPALFDGPIRSAMSRLGELWAHSPQGIFIEHRATDICLQGMHLLRSLIESPPPPPPEALSSSVSLETETRQAGDETSDRGEAAETDTPGGGSGGRPVAVGGGPAGDPYLLPSLAAACVLAECGYREVNLGPDTPMESLRRAALTYGAGLVWISSSVPEQRPSASELTALAHALDPRGARLVLGGRGIESLANDLPGNVDRFDSMHELADYARQTLEPG